MIQCKIVKALDTHQGLDLWKKLEYQNKLLQYVMVNILENYIPPRNPIFFMLYLNPMGTTWNILYFEGFISKYLERKIVGQYCSWL